MSIDVAFFETTPFSLSSIVTSSRGDDDDLLVYYVSLLVPTPSPIPVKPLITHVYSRRQNPPVLSPTPQLLRHKIQSLVMIFLLLFVKVYANVSTQSPQFVLITICHHIPPLLLHPWILSLFLTLSVKLYFTLVRVLLWWKKCKL